MHETAARTGKAGSRGSKEEKGQTTARSHGTSLLKKLLIWNLSWHEIPASGISEASVLSRARLLSSICYRIKSYTPSAGSYCSKIKLLLKIQVELVLWFCLFSFLLPPSLLFLSNLKKLYRACAQKVAMQENKSFAEGFRLCFATRRSIPLCKGEG